MRRAPRSLTTLERALQPALARHSVTQLFEWDQATHCPPAGEQHRGYVSGLISADAHRAFTSRRVGRAIDQAMDRRSDLSPLERRLVERLDFTFRRETALPTDFVQRQAQVCTEAQTAWKEAKVRRSFSRFAPHLQRVLDYVRSEAAYYRQATGGGSLYDALLAGYEPGCTTTQLQAALEQTRVWLVPFLQKLDPQPPPRQRCWAGPFPHQDQLRIARKILSDFGFDFERGVFGSSLHPFSTTVGLDDHRVTTDLTDSLLESIYSTAHEAGHALFDQGSPELVRRMNIFACSLGIHESQSRLWENIVGRSRSYCRYLWPTLLDAYPGLNAATVDDFYRYCNTVQRSPIRIEADEVTYNLHILLRVELEIALIEGQLEVKDLPAAFDDKMEAYLGLRPAHDGEGALQDTHWSEGMFGYFGTYTLGNLLSAQLFQQYAGEHPAYADDFAAGQFAPLLDWLHERVHQDGLTMDIDSLASQVTGEPLNPAHWFRYLEDKFLPLYR